MNEPLIHALNWRYAVKKFSHKKLKGTRVNAVLACTRLAPSSYGLQPFKIVVVEDQNKRDGLANVSYGQTKVANSSHLFVFAIETRLDSKRIIQHIDLMAKTRQLPRDSFASLEKELIGFVKNHDTEWLQAWSKRQCYIALGTLLTSCALLNIDACPMEGFDPKAYDDILGLTQQGLAATVIVTLGHRGDDDKLAGFSEGTKAHG